MGVRVLILFVKNNIVVSHCVDDGSSLWMLESLVESFRWHANNTCFIFCVLHWVAASNVSYTFWSYFFNNVSNSKLIILFAEK